MTSDPAEQAILLLLASRGEGKSISPTDAARALAARQAGNPAGKPAEEHWRKCLVPVRLAANRLARAGQIDILRKGKPVAPADARGVIRLRISSAFGQ